MSECELVTLETAEKAVIGVQTRCKAEMIEVLQEIRREIDSLTVIWPEGGIGMISKFLVMDIIDNHIKEGET